MNEQVSLRPEPNCKNCKKKIKNKDNACYSREVNEFFCSLECFTDFAHEYLGCVPFDEAFSDITSKEGR